MFQSYVQNSQVKMTKLAYYEMCDALGTAPVSSEIPVDMEDFPQEVQEVLQIYAVLQDNWEGMSGTYMGKSFVGITEIFELFGIEPCDRILYLTLLRAFDATRSEEIAKQKPKT